MSADTYKKQLFKILATRKSFLIITFVVCPENADNYIKPILQYIDKELTLQEVKECNGKSPCLIKSITMKIKKRKAS